MISPLAYVSPKAQIGKNVTIDAFAYIDDNVILGDNCVAREYGTTDDDIIGIMTGFYRDRKAHSIDELGYKIYSRLHVFFAPVRIFRKKASGFLKRRLKKLLGKA